MLEEDFKDIGIIHVSCFKRIWRLKQEINRCQLLDISFLYAMHFYEFKFEDIYLLVTSYNFSEAKIQTKKISRKIW